MRYDTVWPFCVKLMYVVQCDVTIVRYQRSTNAGAGLIRTDSVSSLAALLASSLDGNYQISNISFRQRFRATSLNFFLHYSRWGIFKFSVSFPEALHSYGSGTGTDFRCLPFRSLYRSHAEDSISWTNFAKNEDLSNITYSAIFFERNHNLNNYFQ